VVVVRGVEGGRRGLMHNVSAVLVVVYEKDGDVVGTREK